MYWTSIEIIGHSSKNLGPSKKNLGPSKKNWAPLGKTLRPSWCPELVTGLFECFDIRRNKNK